MPSSVLAQRDGLLGEFLGPTASVYEGLGDKYGLLFAQKIGHLFRCVQSSILPEPVFIKTIASTALTLFPTSSLAMVEKALQMQNILSFISSSSGLAYLIMWNQEEAGYPQFDITFIHSIYRPESRHQRFQLEIPSEIFKKESFLWTMLKTMLKKLCIETLKVNDASQENKLRKKAKSEKEEFNLYLSSMESLKESWDNYCKQTMLVNPQEIGLSLFKFIKKIKVSARQMLAGLTYLPNLNVPIDSQNLRELAFQGNIYATPKGLSLLPPALIPEDKYEAYQLTHDKWHSSLQHLKKILHNAAKKSDYQRLEKIKGDREIDEREQKEIAESERTITLKNFFNLEIEKENWNVDVVFRPLFLGAPLKRKAWDFYNEVTFVLKTPKPCSYSIKYKNLIHHPKLETMLGWQLLMLKSTYLAQQF